MKTLFKRPVILIILGILLLLVMWGLLILGLPVQGIFYWLLFSYWIVVIILLKIKSETSLLVALILFAIASVFYLGGLTMIAEEIIRVSFIGLLIGIPQSLIEYQTSNSGI